MTNLTPEILREAVELAEGWKSYGDYAFTTPQPVIADYDDVSKETIAALASQLLRTRGVLGADVRHSVLPANPLQRSIAAFLPRVLGCAAGGQ